MYDCKRVEAAGHRENSFMRKIYGWVGLGIMGGSELSLFAGVSFVCTYFTPLVLSGYILFMDSLVYKKKGASLILSRPKEFLLMLPLSIGFWMIFEFYNHYIRNWYYLGLPENMFLRGMGYAWAFATIWPAILITTEALEGWRFPYPHRMKPFRLPKKYLFIFIGLGFLCLISPLLASPRIGRYLAAPIWLGFIFLLDPLNYLMGGKSLLRDLEEANPRLLYNLLLSGIICGMLWEFWNFWAGAKWYYDIPILGHVKIFEMPILGYLGFPPFAVECYVMYEFVKIIFNGKPKL